MKGIHTFKGDHSTQVVSCRPWTSSLCPYQSLARKKEKLYGNERSSIQPYSCQTHLPQKALYTITLENTTLQNQNHKRIKEEMQGYQSSRRKYKVRLIEKPLVLPRAPATLVPTTTVTTSTTTQPTISNMMSAITP